MKRNKKGQFVKGVIPWNKNLKGFGKKFGFQKENRLWDNSHYKTKIGRPKVASVLYKKGV
jgi:hypothetical protein